MGLQSNLHRSSAEGVKAASGAISRCRTAQLREIGAENDGVWIHDMTALAVKRGDRKWGGRPLLTPPKGREPVLCRCVLAR